MVNRYVFVVMAVVGDPPSGNEIGIVSGDYTFAPFGGSRIYTLDDEVWCATGQCAEPFFFPKATDYNEMFWNSRGSQSTVLVGLVDVGELYVPGRGITILEQLDLGNEFKSFDLGYDVVDSFGLSAITNVGYSKDDMSDIMELGCSVNQYGLIGKRECSDVFVEFVNETTTEHAPFYSVEVKMVN